MRKVLNIFRGWAKAMGLVQVSKAEAKLSELRLHICEGCDHAEESTVLKFIQGEDHLVYSLKCGKCKCPCLEKSLVVDEQCPVGKW
jgi:hypothetical protein